MYTQIRRLKLPNGNFETLWEKKIRDAKSHVEVKWMASQAGWGEKRRAISEGCNPEPSIRASGRVLYMEGPERTETTQSGELQSLLCNSRSNSKSGMDETGEVG